jgi:hypothetical protein
MPPREVAGNILAELFFASCTVAPWRAVEEDRRQPVLIRSALRRVTSSFNVVTF